jgi:hypothetical protein
MFHEIFHDNAYPISSKPLRSLSPSKNDWWTEGRENEPLTYISVREERAEMFWIYIHGANSPSRPRPPHDGDFTITLRHTTLGSTAVEEWWARRWDLHLMALTRDRRPCSWQDPNPQSQQVNGRRSTPQTARPMRFHGLWTFYLRIQILSGIGIY